MRSFRNQQTADKGCAQQTGTVHGTANGATWQTGSLIAMDYLQRYRFLDYVGGAVAGKQRTANLHALYRQTKT